MACKIHNLVFVGLGFTATTSILAFPIAGIYIKLFNVFFILAFILLFFNRGDRIKFAKLDEKYLFWMLIGLLSSLFGAIYFIESPDFQEAAISYVPKILLYTLFFILIKKSKNGVLYSSNICNGLLYGCIFNLAWAVVDAVVFYSTGVSITNTLFSSYLVAANIRYEQASLVIGETIRACGINYDPANIGMFAPIVAFYGLKKRSYVIYGLSVISILASLSHTAFLSVLIVTLYYLYISKHKVVAVLSFVGVVSGAVLLLSVLKNDSIVQMTEAFIERTEQKSDGAELQGARGEYWTNFIPAAVRQPSAFVIGTGYYTASYPYLKNNLSSHEIEPYDPEQTYFSTYFDIGLIGLIVFFSLMFSLFKYSKKYAENGIKQYTFILSGIIGAAVAFLGYHYTLYSVVLLIIIAGIVLCDHEIVSTSK